jgi:hypothetical protein
MLQRVSIIIPIIFRELVGSLLKYIPLHTVTLTRNIVFPEDDHNNDRNMLERFNWGAWGSVVVKALRY